MSVISIRKAAPSATVPTAGITRELAARSAALCYTDLPEDVRLRIRQCLLDWIGVTLAGKAMDEVRAAEFKARPNAVALALGELDRASRRCLSWAMRTHHAGWNERHMQAMYALQRTNLQSARAWRLKVALRGVYEAAAHSQSEEVARTGLESWIGWAMRSRLEPFKRLARTLRTHFEGVIAGMKQGRSNAFVEAMNGLMQNAKRAARGFRTSTNFIAIAYLRMSKLKHLPANPFEHAAPRFAGLSTHRC